MKIFCYQQNNSFGVFKGAKRILIEAETPIEADAIAINHGIYFDGCDKGIDCSCCGDRWRNASDYSIFYDEESIYSLWMLLFELYSFLVIFKNGDSIESDL